MKIKCDYCGHIIDSEIDKLCPHCGAKIERLEVFNEREKIELEREKLRNEEQRYNNELKKQHLKAQKFDEKVKDTLKKLKIVLTIILVIGITTSIVNIVSNIISPSKNTEISEISKIEEPKEVYAEGTYNNPVSNGVLSVTIDEAKEYDNKYGNETEGYRYVKLHFVVQNVSDKEVYDNNSVKAFVDGVQCEKVRPYDDKQLPEEHIVPNAKIDGYLAYSVPEDTNQLEIHYGDYIKIFVPIELENRNIVHEGNINEAVKTKRYSVMIDELSNAEIKYLKPNTDYSFKKIHVVFENLSENDLKSNESFVLLADGIQCDRKYMSDIKEFSSKTVSPGAKTDGYLAFEIPNNAKKLQFKYGKNIIINIDNN